MVLLRQIAFSIEEITHVLLLAQLHASSSHSFLHGVRIEVISLTEIGLNNVMECYSSNADAIIVT